LLGAKSKPTPDADSSQHQADGVQRQDLSVIASTPRDVKAESFGAQKPRTGWHLTKLARTAECRPRQGDYFFIRKARPLLDAFMIRRDMCI